MRRLEQIRRHVQVGTRIYGTSTVQTSSKITGTKQPLTPVDEGFVNRHYLYQRSITTVNNAPHKQGDDNHQDDVNKPIGTVILQQQDQQQHQQLSQDWIPPNRPLVGDIGNPYHIKSNYFVDEEEELRQLEIEIQKLEEEEREQALREKQLEEQQLKLFERMYQQEQPDWNKLRRSIFGTNTTKTTNSFNTNNATAANAKKENGETESVDNHDIIPCKLYTLLSKDEIIQCLTFYGGQDIVLILDDFKNPRMGGAIGIIIVTANSIMQMRQLGDVLVRQLRKRMLQERGVVGAELGMEGDHKSSRNAMDYDDSLNNQKWFVVDCFNYIVHIQDDTTRKAVNLEGLWSGSDPMFQIRDLRDEEVVDTYISTYPIPDSYVVHSGYISKRQQRQPQTTIDSSSRTSLSSLIAGQRQQNSITTGRSSSLSFAETINRLQKSRFTVNREPDKNVSSRNKANRQKRKQALKEKQHRMKRL